MLLTRYYAIGAWMALSAFHSASCQRSGGGSNRNTNSSPSNPRQGGTSVRQNINGVSLLIGAAGLAATAGFVSGLIIGESDRGRRTRFRGKRDVHLPDSAEETVIGRAAEMDHSGCAARLLCELHQQDPTRLDAMGRNLIQLFDGQQAPTVEQLRADSRSVFQYAAFLGSNSATDRKICGQVFHKCPLNATTMLALLKLLRAHEQAELSGS